MSEMFLKPSKNSLAGHVSTLLMEHTGSATAALTLIHIALAALVARRTHTLHMATAGQRAGLGVHAVMVADV